MKLPRIDSKRLTPDVPFVSGDTTRTLTASDFWSWAYSDMVNNSQRGILAEYIVATAIGADSDLRIEWDAYDLTTKSGIKVEVKSGAYIQSWEQKKYSNITFSIRPTRAWNESDGQFEGVVKRQSDVYVFCLLKHKDQATINPMDLSQWEFYVVPTSRLNQAVGDAKSLGLKKLLSLDPHCCSYGELAVTVENAASGQHAVKK